MSFKEWYHEAQTYSRYNCMCEWFNPVTEKCMVFGTKNYPVECAIFVCHLREFSKEELENIRRIYESKIITPTKK